MIFMVDENPSEKNILNEENAKHLKALRPDVGEEVAILDLKGNANVYVVSEIKPLALVFKKALQVEEPQIKTKLFLAPPADSALEQAVEQATEVGYDSIHFLRSERVQIPKSKSLPLSRLKRVVQASCKQCGRFWAPVIDEKFHSFREAVSLAKDSLVIFADESAAKNTWGSIQGILPKQIKSVTVFIGPEGGWSEEERRSLAEVSRVFSLGPHVLRVPTAVVSAYALIWKELSHG